MEKKKILIIDDDEDLCNMLKMHLEVAADFDVYTALNGRDGLKLARKIKPDLAVLDILMPGLDGFQVLEALKQDNATVKIPVIMLSGKDDDLSKAKATKLYDELYLTKPIDGQQLKVSIEEVLNRRSGKISR